MSQLKYVSEFRDGDVARGLARKIREIAAGLPTLRFMEVCGTHTMAIHRHGIKQLLPDNVELISGPGCPVCVTANSYIDRAIAYARTEGVTVCTFGDMVRVPGSSSSLEAEKAKRADVRVVYSPLDAVEIARRNPDRQVVFLGVGFETTAPTVAATLAEAKRGGLENFSVSCAHKTMPQALAALVDDGHIGLSGFILPAHVSTIIGSEPYRFLAKKHDKACVIAGFEPVDILQGVLMLIGQIATGRATVEVQYSRVVRAEGNPKALRLMEQIFEVCDAEWRGLGVIPRSGLRISSELGSYNADRSIKVSVEQTKENPACICGDVLRGLKIPPDCRLFGSACTPEKPIGACMVSSEGTCAAYYKYGEERRRTRKVPASAKEGDLRN